MSAARKSPNGAPRAAAKDAAQDADAGKRFWGSRLTEPPEMMNIAYCAGRDVAPRPMADAELVPFDVWQNRAHVAMLARQGIIPTKQAGRIARALNRFEEEVAAGRFALDPRKEDVHTNIEHFVADAAGAEDAGVIHTGRSRNDQSATVVRMYVRSRLLSFADALGALVEALLGFATAQAAVPVAGFTHYQPASVTTLGHWFASHAQSLSRDLGRLVECHDRLNVSPLGAAASFGTSWPIDRALTARLLGFDSVQANSLDCVTNRWEFEADAASAVLFAMTHLSILAQDLILLSHPALGILRIADRFVTGSSIMPQKRNPDFAEVTRAKAALIEHLTGSLFSIARGALSGYNRDTQWTKYIIMDIFDEAREAPGVFAGVIGSLGVDSSRAAKSAENDFVNAVDVADSLARDSGLPFRAAYGIVSAAVRRSDPLGRIDLGIVRALTDEAGAKPTNLNLGCPMAIAESKSHEGGPAPKTVFGDVRRMVAGLKKLRAGVELRESRLGKAAAELRAIEAKNR